MGAGRGGVGWVEMLPGVSLCDAAPAPLLFAPNPPLDVALRGVGLCFTDGLTARNTTIVVAVCIVCVLGLVLVATYTVKHYRDKHAPPRRPSQAEPTPDGGPATGAPPPVSRSQ